MTPPTSWRWPKARRDLGPGIDATLADAFWLWAGGGQPTAVSALAAKILPRHQGLRLSAMLLTVMADLAREAGLNHLVAPVRPSHKDRYLAIPIERYVRWTRPDGTPFDPRIRVHTRLGARIGPAIPAPCTSPVRSASGNLDAHGVPRDRGLRVPRAGLATVRIDRDRDLGEYWEPNVWIIHQTRRRLRRRARKERALDYSPP